MWIMFSALDSRQSGRRRAVPISFLSDRHRAQRLGRVRLGIKKVSQKTGREYPSATPYFVLNDTPELKQFYGEQATSLNIEFLWDNLERTFPHYMRRYVASGLRCLGDGDLILYRVNGAGEVDVRDGNAVHPNGKVIVQENQPVKVHCAGERCEHYADGSCKPTGFLRFLPVEAPRLGYYDLVCHQRAVVGILTQLKLTQAIFGRITGIPFILHRGEEEKVPVKVPGKGMVDMPIRTQWIEIEPGWFAENWPQREKHLALARSKVKQDIIELFGEDSNGDNSLPPPAVSEMAEPVFRGEGTQLTVPDDMAEPESQIVDSDEGLHVIRRDVSAVQNFGQLYTATREDFNLSRDETLVEAGVKRQADIVNTPRDVYLSIAAARGVTVIPPDD
jgi:hypothetical protein